VRTLRKLFAKLLDTNESKDRKITELEREVANTNAVRGEVTGRTSNYIAEPSSASARVTHSPPEKKAAPPGGGRLYSEAGEGKTIQKRYKLIVTSKNDQTADKIKETLKQT